MRAGRALKRSKTNSEIQAKKRNYDAMDLESGSSHLSLMRIFDQPKFSDLIVTVNDIDDISPPKQYYLHQAVVLTASKYLNILCAALPTDSEIKDDNLELSQLGGLLEAAQIVQIEDFRTLILQTAVELVASKHGAHLSLGFMRVTRMKLKDCVAWQK
ncbi:hypothetical protein TWF102_002741 [Orbilia oligospora]|uniref:BTB domain-containing protein n=1 Tax=Orbilia oligospora TaxID=2813651 RepID=A0A7C8JDR5_ORBOL|nr:hypothetical protein TWF102_002741 [Orbilia oligospora]